MRIIDRKWTDLAAGYQAVLACQIKLEAEFGRAVQVGHKQKFRRDLTEWQKKRRVFFGLAAIAPLSMVALCLAAFYFREVACVLIYWTMLVAVILVTLAVAGWGFIREMVDGRPVPKPVDGLAVDLEARWWASLAPQALAVSAPAKPDEDFLTLLTRSLPDTFLSFGDPGLLCGSSGVWMFQVEAWSGTIARQDNVWKQILKKRVVKAYETNPDDKWLERKKQIVNMLAEHPPQPAWTPDLLHGGVAFSHPKASLEKANILGNTAAYGPAKAWIERLRRAPAVDSFTLDAQLEILETLAERGDQPTISAKAEAERLYHQAAEELRQAVAKMVK